MIFEFKSKKFEKRVYSWKRKDGKPNVGDDLAKKLVKQILLFKDLDEEAFALASNTKLLSIGSVMHFAKDNDVIWGTGVNGKVEKKLHNFNMLDVRAVRGPRTKIFLEQKGIDAPEIYGDPALLCPLFFQKDLFIENEKKSEFVVVPHMSELEKFRSIFPEELICSPLQKPYSFIQKILNAEKVFSSSLHGIILAEAYGVPVYWMHTGSEEEPFKYHDYFEGTNRYNNKSEFDFYKYRCTEYDGIKDLHGIQIKLLKAFPYDFWKIN